MQDFYEHQDAARHNTLRMIGWMILAAVGTILISGISIGYAALLLVYLQVDLSPQGQLAVFAVTFVVGAIATGCFVTVSSWLKVRQIRREGAASLARKLGSRLVTEDDADSKCRQLLNIVQEMSMAAGIPVPDVYVLPMESGINAFAAGFSADDALIGVTEGCINRLSRDQLQGVIAHEYAHIMNGDMRMNLKLVGLLHGLIAITLAAELLIEFGLRPRASDHDASAGIALVLLGALLWPVGLIGFTFSLIVKAAISRQREYLADATAVELTRHPQGLSGALKVIAGYTPGSRVRNVHAVELSHFFFAEGCGGLTRLVHMHPPVSRRIQRLDPLWDGTPIFEHDDDVRPYRGLYCQTMQLVGIATSEASADEWERPEELQDSLEGDNLVDLGGSQERLRQHIEEVRAGIPGVILECCQLPAGVPAMLLALWSCDASDCSSGWRSALPRRLVEAVGQLTHTISKYDEAQRILLLDTATQTLAKLSPAERKDFHKQWMAAKAATARPTTFQWACDWMVTGQLNQLDAPKDPPPIHGDLEPVLGACEVLLSALVYAGQSAGPSAAYAFQRAAAHTGYHDLTLRPPGQTNLAAVDAALDQLRRVAIRGRRNLLLACAACLSSDREISVQEAHLIRGICRGLQFPPPTLLPGQPVMPGA
jgi:Zn-dependent protease with chaperone function